MTGEGTNGTIALLTTAEGIGDVDDRKRAIGARLEEHARARAALAATVRAGWDGPVRARFDAERAARDARLAAIIATCRRPATTGTPPAHRLADAA